VNENAYIRKFFIVAGLALSIGAVHGVIMTTPTGQNFLEASFRAGHQVDPLALGHIFNLGWVTFSIIGLIYYAIPAVFGRPIHSVKIADVSFWFMLAGAVTMYTGWIYLGLSEWALMRDQGMLYAEAKAAMGAKIHIISVGATPLNNGYWGFFYNLFRTFFEKK